VACGSQPDIDCGPDNSQTWGDLVLHDVAECCHIGNEVKVDVKLEDGCATAVQVGWYPADKAGLAACIGHLLAGRRITCAKSTACIHAEYSSLQ
jgi:hypothetical protein